MNELEKIGEEAAFNYVFESCIAEENSTLVELEGNYFLNDFTKDHEGGLEGWYSDTYNGTLYINNEAYYYEFTDTFCSGTECSGFDRALEADLREGDEDYVYLQLTKDFVEITEGLAPDDPLKVALEMYKEGLSDLIKTTGKQLDELASIPVRSELETDAELKERLRSREEELTGWWGASADINTATGSNLDAIASLVGIERKRGEMAEFIVSGELVFKDQIPEHIHTGAYNCTISTNTTAATEQTNLNNTGETTMTNTTRTLHTMILIDEDKNLPVDLSLLAKFDSILSEETTDVIIQELCINEDIKGLLKKHNDVRAETINQTILERTGKKVMLQPVKIKDLTWQVK